MSAGDSDSAVKPSRLADGFFVIARDLDRALRVARFSWLERALFDEAREMSWAPGLRDGSREAKPFTFNLSALSRLWRCNRMNVRFALRRLVAARVFIQDGTAYRISKDYRQWRDDNGEPLLSPTQLAWCAGARIKPAPDMPAHQATQPSSDMPAHHPLMRQRITPRCASASPQDNQYNPDIPLDVDTNGVAANVDSPPKNPPVGCRARLNPERESKRESRESRGAAASAAAAGGKILVPIPPEWEDLCTQVASAFNGVTTALPERLRAEWRTRRSARCQEMLEAVPLDAWLDTAREFARRAEEDPSAVRKFHPGYFLAAVRNRHANAETTPIGMEIKPTPKRSRRRIDDQLAPFLEAAEKSRLAREAKARAQSQEGGA